MHPLHAATLTVADAQAAAARYEAWFDYRRREDARVSAALAHSWGAPACEGARMIVMQPADPAGSFLRLIEQPPTPSYQPLRSFGWAAIEICVQDVAAVEARMTTSPFEIIGPSKPLDGWPSIKPMQIKGPDGEIVYLTEIQACPPGMLLRQAQSMIDSLFILVAAFSNLEQARGFATETLGLSVGAVSAINYTMLQKSFAMPTAKFELCTANLGALAFLELDQYPAQATSRPRLPEFLPPGCALGGLNLPDLDRFASLAIAPPQLLPGPYYQGRRALTLRGPDDILIELIESPE
jgi:hypothetical protein